jgi:REP element-mobilizing transposase RayT
MRKHKFVIGEYYHIYNRGVDKRETILDPYDLHRFLESMREFNVLEPIGSIYQLSFIKNKLSTPTTTKSFIESKKIVSIIAYCVNPNHFHFLITPLVEKGVEKFMQKIGGYTRYFNEKYKRNGTLFQGKFKSKHIGTDNRYLLHLSAYINMNNRNSLGTPTNKLSKSSLEEYTENKKGLCDTEIVLEQFENKKEYFKFALESWQNIQERKKALEM